VVGSPSRWLSESFGLCPCPSFGDLLSKTCSSVFSAIMAKQLIAYTCFDLRTCVSCRSQFNIGTDHLSPSSSVLCCRLHLPPAVLVSLFHGLLLPLWLCGVHCSACMVMLSSFHTCLLLINPITVYTLALKLRIDLELTIYDGKLNNKFITL